MANHKTISLNKDKYDYIKAFCDEYGYTMTKFVFMLAKREIERIRKAEKELEND